jgi:hypothetical protein
MGAFFTNLDSTQTSKITKGSENKNVQAQEKKKRKTLE